MQAIKLVAHRGYQKHYPENTLRAMSQAILAGAEYIETDVQISADGEPVLYHDRTLKATGSGKVAVHDLPYASLVDLPCHEPQRFGTQYLGQTLTPLAELVALLAAQPQVQAFIEVKSCTIEAHGIKRSFRIVSDALAPVAPRCTLISFDRDFIAHARRADWHSVGLVTRSWKMLQEAATRQIRPDYVFINVKYLPRRGSLRLPDTRLVVYEIASPAQALALNNRGIDFIETFAIGEMRQALSLDRESCDEAAL